MDIFFSPGACAFFTPALHGDAVPADAVAITADAHRALIEVALLVLDALHVRSATGGVHDGLRDVTAGDKLTHLR